MILENTSEKASFELQLRKSDFCKVFSETFTVLHLNFRWCNLLSRMENIGM